MSESTPLLQATTTASNNSTSDTPHYYLLNRSDGNDGLKESWHRKTNISDVMDLMTSRSTSVDKAMQKSSSSLPSSVLCLAVLKNNGQEVDLFDAQGQHRAFSMMNPSAAMIGVIRNNTNTVAASAISNISDPKICFSTHGLVGTDGIPADALLTPCLDEKGLHIGLGASNISTAIVNTSTVGSVKNNIDVLNSDGTDTLLGECFVCDIRTPHLHAHLHDPIRCSIDYSNLSANSSTTKPSSADGDDVDRTNESIISNDMDHSCMIDYTKRISSELDFLASITYVAQDEVTSHHRPNHDHRHDHGHSQMHENDSNLQRIHDHSHVHANEHDHDHSHKQDDERARRHDHAHNHTNSIDHSQKLDALLNGHDSKKHQLHERERDCLNVSHHQLHDSDDNVEGLVTAHLPITESLPKQCNSKELSQRRSELQLHGCGDDDFSSTDVNDWKPLFKVKHDDHIDILVHNDRTGNLHLEHPCNSCGENDLHGKFDFVGTRQLIDRCVSRQSNANEAVMPTVKLHFFALPHKPFHLMDVLSDIFSLDSPDRVAAVREISSCCGRKNCNEEQKYYRRPSSRKDTAARLYPRNRGYCESCTVISDDERINVTNNEYVDEKMESNSRLSMQERLLSSCCADSVCSKVMLENSTATNFISCVPKLINDTIDEDRADSQIVRSQLSVQGICCSSETPQIVAIIKPLPGVHSVRVNTQLKLVVIEHNLFLQAQDLKRALDLEKFYATIMVDGVKEHHSYLDKNRVASSGNNHDRSQFFVENICCAAEIEPIRKVIQNIEGVYESAVNVTTKMVYVRHNCSVVTASDIANRLKAEYFRATLIFDAAEQNLSLIEKADKCADADGSWSISEQANGASEENMSKLKPSIVVCGVFWVISMLSYLGENWHALKYLGIVSVIIGVPSIAPKAFRTIRRRQFDVNCMMLLAIVGATALLDFEEAASVTFLFSISEWLETMATSRARKALSSIVSLRPDKANIVDEQSNNIVTVSATTVSVGAKVCVRNGEKVPCDGLVIQGLSTVNESSLTGESVPVKKGIGDIVSGGTINCGMAPLYIEVTATIDDSAISKLIRLVEDAQMNRSPTEMMVDSFAKRYTPFVVLLSLCMMTIPWAWGIEVGRLWFKHGLIAIVLACPCALVISTPVTYVAALAATAQKGVLIKGGAFLEALGKVRKICFDKTGTLTEGHFSLLSFEVIGNQLTRKTIFEYLACVEAAASHPIASALLLASKNEGVSMHDQDFNVQDHTVLEGEGVSARINSQMVYAGNIRLFQRLGLYDDLPANLKLMVNDWSSKGESIGFISIGDYGIVAAYSVADPIRHEAKSVVTAIIHLGIHVSMLTGDNHGAALVVADQVGIDRTSIRSQLLPHEKLDIVKCMKDEMHNERSSRSTLCPCPTKEMRRGLVLMCGDGVNDAPALATADISVSMGAGAAVSIESSDITLMDCNLEKLLYSIHMGIRVRRVIIQNISFSLTAKAAVMIFVLVGRGGLWLAIASDVVAMLIVTANGMTLLPSSRMVDNMKQELLPNIV